MCIDGGDQPRFERLRIGYGPEVKNKAVEFVMVMLAVNGVMAGSPRGQIILGGGGQPKQDIGIDARLLGLHNFYARAQFVSQQ